MISEGKIVTSVSSPGALLLLEILLLLLILCFCFVNLKYNRTTAALLTQDDLIKKFQFPLISLNSLFPAKKMNKNTDR
jgi:hypothetical protein